MKIRFGICSILMSFLLISVYSGDVLGATSGAFNILALDAEAIAKGNAFTGEADNASAVQYNPAGITQLKGNSHISFGMAGFIVDVEHTSLTGVDTQMRQNLIMVPHMYAVGDIGLENTGFVYGLGVNSNYGASTDWAKDSFSKYVATKTELQSIDYLLTGAYQLTDNLSVGLGLNIVDTKLTEKSAINQVAVGDAQAQIRGSDVGYGYTLAGMYKVNKRHQFGLKYRSPIEFELVGQVDAVGLNPGSLPNNFVAIFGGTNFTTEAIADFELPQSLALGYSFRPDNKWIVNFDVSWTDWGAVEQQNFEFPKANTTQQATLNALADLPLDWESTISFGFGGEYQISDKLSGRLGYFYNPTPMPQGTFITFLPSADSHGVNVGAGIQLKENVNLDLAYTTIFFEDRDIVNNVGASSAADIDGKYEQIIYVAAATVSFKF